ncbi:MAG: HEPN domain-containing protein [Phycisphaerales bacterium]|nr:HEPN domain-containing protein [Phycisphaerales bacterium]
MKREAREWIAKAEEDFEAAEKLAKSRRATLAAVIGFHSQQCVEKYLKARLLELDAPVPRTHDLVALIAELVKWESPFALIEPHARSLAPFAVKCRTRVNTFQHAPPARHWRSLG